MSLCTGLTPLKHEYHYTGELTVPEPSTPARMQVRFPLSKYHDDHILWNIHIFIILTVVKKCDCSAQFYGFTSSIITMFTRSRFSWKFFEFEHIRLRHCFVKYFKESPMNGPITYTKQFNLLVFHLSLLT